MRELRATLALNLRARMAAFYPQIESETTRAQQLGKDSGVGKNTVIRMLQLDGSSHPRLDNISRIAHRLRITVSDLLEDHAKKKKKPKGAAVKSSTEPLREALQRR